MVKKNHIAVKNTVRTTGPSLPKSDYIDAVDLLISMRTALNVVLRGMNALIRDNEKPTQKHAKKRGRG